MVSYAWGATGILGGGGGICPPAPPGLNPGSHYDDEQRRASARAHSYKHQVHITYVQFSRPIIQLYYIYISTYMSIQWSRQHFPNSPNWTQEDRGMEGPVVCVRKRGGRERGREGRREGGREGRREFDKTFCFLCT